MHRINTKQWELLARQTEYACMAYAWETGFKEGLESARIRRTENYIKNILALDVLSTAEISTAFGWEETAVQKIKDDVMQ